MVESCPGTPFSLIFMMLIWTLHNTSQYLLAPRRRALCLIMHQVDGSFTMHTPLKISIYGFALAGRRESDMYNLHDVRAHCSKYANMRLDTLLISDGQPQNCYAKKYMSLQYNMLYIYIYIL